MASRELFGIDFPYGELAVVAATVLPLKGLVAQFLKFRGVHGNSLGLTSKSPLTRTRMAGAVVQRIGGAWA